MQEMVCTPDLVGRWVDTPKYRNHTSSMAYLVAMPTSLYLIPGLQTIRQMVAPSAATEMDRYCTCHVSLLILKLIQPHAYSSLLDDTPISGTLPFGHSRIYSLARGSIRLLLIPTNDSLTLVCQNRYFPRATRMLLSEMFIKAGIRGEQRPTAFLWTFDSWIFTLGAVRLMFPSQMYPHIVFPNFAFKCFIQILTTTTMPR